MTNFVELPDDVKYAVLLKWLDENVVKKISYENNEPLWMLEHRLQCLKIFQEKSMPTWGPDISDLDFDSIVFFAKPEALEKEYAKDWDDVPEEMKNKFEKLGIPEAERKYLAGAGWQFDSEMVYHNIKDKWADKWVIFEDMNEALHSHEDLVKKYFMKLIPASYHKFSALHGAVWSGGTFIHIPKWIKLTEPLQTYFRMNTLNGWQFEHTIIVLEEDSEGSYIEWCSAPKYNSRALHAGGVEIFVWKWAKMRYSSVENWSTDTYNLNTKKALVEENAYIEWIWGNFGSAKTMLYPMSVLKGDNAKADHLWVAYAGENQIQDVGVKVLHIGKNTSSKIVSKSICKNGGINIYRGMVDVRAGAENTVNTTQCDAILLDNKSISDTIPTINSENTNVSLAHEASAGKIDENSLFYLTSRGIKEDEAAALIVNGFISPVIKKLPLEYAGELNRLIELEMEDSIW